jgi:hypothetical protein
MMPGSPLVTASKEHSVWNLFPVLLLALLVVLLLCVFLFAPVTVTLDGYSHLYGAAALRWMLGGQPEAHSNFSYNSVLVPNWVCAFLLAALSSIVSNEWALKLLVVLIGMALLSSLYFCIDPTLYQPHQRAQVLIALLPFALNAFLALGYYGFLISSSLCIFVLGLLLRHGLSMPLRMQCVAAWFLLLAYFSHPLPVIISFLFPFALFMADTIIYLREGWRRSATALKRLAFYIWPWMPPACLLPWFYLRLSKVAEPRPDSIMSKVTQRTLALARDAVPSISPTADVATLFVALLTILLAGVILCRRKLLVQNRFRFTSLTVLMVSTLVLFLTVPDAVGDGTDIAKRVLLYSAIFLVLLALSSGVFDAQLLTLSSLIAAISVIGFAGEYLVVSKRLAPAVAEVRLAMESVPRHSRILIMGYRMTPSSCDGSPLLQMSVPERHWALIGALKNELIVLNDYEAYTTYFPLESLTPRYADVQDEVDLNSEQDRAVWFNILKSDPDVDFVVSWGVSRRANCTNAVYPPFEEALKTRHDMVFFKQGASRVELWRKRQ